ncbi:MAG: M50 family metallopeptidase [Acidimicrobiia bacterium]|nr:M50 family metallopeptidase [Acidimicrobiia bacterium]
MTGGLIVLFGIVSMVMIHEAGHFLAAKAFGMKATEFFFGFGPRIWSTKRGETEYGVKAIPLGGYVRIIGMNPYEEVAPEDEGRTYRERPFWQKSIVVLAGVASHFIVAFVLFFLVFSLIGVNTLSPTVSSVQDTLPDGGATPAAEVGLEPGDRIVSIDGIETPEWVDLVDVVSARPGETVTLRVERDGTIRPLEVTLASVDDQAGGKRGFLGVAPSTETERVNPIVGFGRAGGAVGEAVVVSTQGMWQLVTGLGDLIGATITGDTEGIDEVRPASPIGLVRIGAQTQDLGIGFTLELVALINVFVGLFNFIPIYPLDGGHFSVALYEKIRGREADVRKLAPIAAAVVIFMVLLGVLAIYLDIANPLDLN